MDNGFIVFDILAHNICLCNRDADLRDMLKFSCVNTYWQKKISDTAWFWEALKNSVLMYHAESSKANLKAEIRENIREVSSFFASPRILGIHQIGFINLCARAFTRSEFYNHYEKDKLGELEPSMPTLYQLGTVIEAAIVGFRVLPIENRQRVADFPLDYKADIDYDPNKPIAPENKFVRDAMFIALLIDCWVEKFKIHFAAPTLKVFCNTLPREVKLFVGLKLLHLNNVIYIPTEIGDLPALQVLKIENYYEKGLKKALPVPSSIGNLKTLQRLTINGRRLKKLPKEFANLKNLKRVILKGNNFEKFPKTLFELKNLENACLTSCNIYKVGKNIVKMKSLKGLALQQNQIDSLPESIVHLPNLKRLTLKQNPIKTLPEGLCLDELHIPPHTRPPSKQKSHPGDTLQQRGRLKRVECETQKARLSYLETEKTKLEERIAQTKSKKPKKSQQKKLEELDAEIQIHKEKLAIALEAPRDADCYWTASLNLKNKIQALGALGPQNHKVPLAQQTELNQMFQTLQEQEIEQNQARLLEDFEQQEPLFSFDQEIEFDLASEANVDALEDARNKRKNPFLEDQDTKRRRL